MDKKQTVFACILGFTVSVGIGAGSVYLANYKKIDFMNRHTGFIEAEEFVKETLELPVPESDKENEYKAYFNLYGDEYTRYGSENDYFSEKFILDEVNDSSCAKLGGYRVRFNENEEPYFSVVEEGMPAYEQGIRAGDIVKSVDDFELTEFRHIKRLNGDDGAAAKLILERDGKEISVNYIRHADMREEKSAVLEMYGNTLYADVNSIDGYFMSLLENETDFDSVIIDLRQNSGGNTDNAVSIADYFIGESKTVLHAYSGYEQSLTTTDEIKFDVPIVVLVDNETASAAEILTALLKQYGDATLVGMNTFGKGIYQYTAILNNNSVIYTDGYYTVGDWECYQGTGIKPDVEIDMNPDYIGTDKDVQFEKALEIIGEKQQKNN